LQTKQSANGCLDIWLDASGFVQLRRTIREDRGRITGAIEAPSALRGHSKQPLEPSKSEGLDGPKAITGALRRKCLHRSTILTCNRVVSYCSSYCRFLILKSQLRRENDDRRVDGIVATIHWD